MRAAAVHSLPEQRVHKSPQSIVHDGQGMLACAVVHFGDAEDTSKFTGIYLHRSRLGRSAGRRLRKRRGHPGVEGGIAFGLLEHLMDLAVEDRDRAEAFQVAERT